MSGLGLTQMNSLLASQNAMKTVSDLNAHKTALKGQMGVIGSEIESDKERGVDTADKEQRYANMEGKETSILEKIGDTASGLNERIAEDNEKIREEEAAKTSETTKTEKAADDSKSGEVKPGATTAEYADTVEISAFAQNVAASMPQIAPEIPAEQEARTGAVVDVKV